MNSNSKFKTQIGGCFAIIMIILSIILFGNFGSDMFYHQNPSVIFSEIFSKNPQKTFFSKEKDFFMFGLEAPNNYAHFIDETIYTVNIINKQISKLDNDSFTINVPFERCTEAHLPEEPNIHEYFMRASGSPINELICIKNIEKYFIEGSFDTNVYTFFELKIKACSNKTDDPFAPICKSPEEIKYAMSGFFAFYTMDCLINPQNYTNPGQYVGKDYFSPISVGMTRNTHRYIATSLVNSDDGFLFQSKNTYKYSILAEDKETLLMDTGTGVVMDFNLRKFHNELIYERKYKKFQNVLAEMGGFIQILYFFFFMISYPFISKLYYEKIVNSVYNFELDSSKEGNVAQLKSTKRRNFISNQLPFYRSLNLPTAFSNDIKILRNQKEKFIKYMVKIKNMPPLKITFWDFLLKSFFCCKKNERNEILFNKFKRMKKGKDLVKEKFDISFIMKKFYEIDKLKMLLMNENQYHLFDYLPKPVIQKNSKLNLGNSKKKTFLSYEADVVGKAEKMFNAYQNVKNQNELSVMDQRLIDLLDDNIKDIMYFIIFFKCLS